MKLHNEPGGFQQINWLHFMYVAEAWDMASCFLPLLKNEFMTFADSVQLEGTETLIHLLEVQLVGVLPSSLLKSTVVVMHSILNSAR